MATRAKPRPKRKSQAPNPLADLGLFNVPSLNLDEESGDDSDVDEGSLENELEALLSGKVITRQKPKSKIAAPVDIERLAADCLKDDDDDDDEDEEEDLLSNNELLKELQKLSPDAEEESEVSEPMLVEQNERRPSSTQEAPKSSVLMQLEERLKLYKDAIEAAKQLNDSMKVRRYGRAVKTLESLLKSAKAGTAINEEDIPPVVSIPRAPSAKPPQRSSSTDVPTHVGNVEHESIPTIDKSSSQPPIELEGDSSSSVCAMLNSRRNEYKLAALEAKRAGNKELAIEYLRTAKTFDPVMQAANSNQPVDLSNLPPPLSLGKETIISGSGPQKRAEEQIQNSSAIEAAALAAANDEEQPAIFAAPPAPSTILECLIQRLEKYNATKQAAEAEGNSGKVRRLQRIVKTYETAIKDYKAGKTVDYNELPCPPGFAPFPSEGNNANSQAPIEKPKEPKLLPHPQTSAEHKPVAPPPKPATSQLSVKKPKVQRAATFTGEKQLEFLMERQKLFRQAALTSKQQGDVQQAKEYLRMSKGFDSLIDAVKSGLPIDTSQIPTPPQLETDFVIVDVSDCEEHSDISQEELFETLQADLANQMEICRRNKEHFMRLGDVSSASKFEKLSLESKKDLAVLQHLKKTGQSAPKFRYETRLFSMVICNPELADNEIEICVERGINLPGKPDDLDSYVKVELPIPSEAPQIAKTHTIRDTNNPEFGETFKFEINRKSRSQLRSFKRHCLKLELWSKGGFLRSDKLLGTASVKLIDLESKCIVHDSFNLMEGRKNVGGKLEVKLRIREPLLAKQVEEVREKWLIVGS